MKVPVTSVRRRDESRVAHSRDEASDRALKSHSSRIGCSAGHAAKLRVAIVQFDVSDDELAVGGVEPGERRAIARVVIDVDGSFERRGCRVRERGGQRLGGAAPCKAPMFIADPVSDRGAKVRAERIAPLEIEGVEAANGSHHDVVYEVRCIGVSSRPSGQSTVGPAMETREETTDELGERALVAAAIPPHEPPGGAIERRRETGVRGRRRR